MTYTLLECSACGWSSAGHQTAEDAAKAGVAHLGESHPNMSPPQRGAEAIQMYSYVTLGEYLSAREREPHEEPAEKSTEEEPEEEEETDADEESARPERTPRGPPRRGREPPTEDKVTPRRGRQKITRRKK